MTNYCWETSSVVVFTSCCALILQLLYRLLLLSVVALYSSSVVVPLHISGCDWSVVVLYSVVAVLALLIFIFQQSAIRQLAYGDVPDSLDEFLQMSERVSRESLNNFCDGVICLYAKEFLRRPTSTDVQLLYQAHSERHRFPGMLGSIDCTH